LTAGVVSPVSLKASWVHPCCVRLFYIGAYVGDIPPARECWGSVFSSLTFLYKEGLTALLSS